ncbi:MAG: MFS transporter [Trueperaceae bacterium]|nr:MFS transporter [Trueperaceae bacterium]
MRLSLLALYVVVAAVFATQAMMAPLVPLFGLSLGASPAVIGLLVSAGFVLPLFGALAAGSLVDRRGARPLIVVGALGMTAAPLVVVALPTLFGVAVAQLGLGLAHLVVIVAAQTLVASLGGGRAREKNFGWYTMFVSAGQLLGPLLAGVLVDSAGFGVAFAVAAGVSALGAGCSLLLPSGLTPQLGSQQGEGAAAETLGKDAVSSADKDGDEASGDASLGETSGGEGVLELLRRPGVRVALSVSAAVLFSLSVYQAFFPAYLDALAFSATVVGGLLSLRALASLLVRPFTARIMALFARRLQGLKVMLLLIAVGLGLTGLFDTLLLLGLLAIVVGVGVGIAQPISMVTVVDHVDSHIWGFALGLRLTGNRLAQVLGPALLGVSAEVLGFDGMFLLAGGVLVVAIGLLQWWGPAFDRAEKARGVGGG